MTSCCRRGNFLSPTHLSACPGSFETESPRPGFQTSSRCRLHSQPETGTTGTQVRRGGAREGSRVSTHRQHGSLRVAADAPDGASVGAGGVPGPQRVQVIFRDLTVQPSTEETLGHPAQGPRSPAPAARDDLQTARASAGSSPGVVCCCLSPTCVFPSRPTSAHRGCPTFSWK